MRIRILFATAVAIAATGCTTYSGPTYNTDVVKLSDGSDAYRAQCQGLLEGTKTCFAQAKKICADKPVRLVGSVDHATTGYKPENDPREITFKCGAPERPIVERPIAQPAPVAVAPAAPAIGRRLTLQSDATFGVNSAVLSPLAAQKLDAFIEANQGVRIEHLTIAGYTDATGSSQLNLRLSDARARSVRSYLESHGLHASHYEVHGYGIASPVASNASAEGRAKNRRVEIQADGK